MSLCRGFVTGGRRDVSAVAERRTIWDASKPLREGKKQQHSHGTPRGCIGSGIAQVPHTASPQAPQHISGAEGTSPGSLGAPTAFGHHATVMECAVSSLSSLHAASCMRAKIGPCSVKTIPICQCLCVCAPKVNAAPNPLSNFRTASHDSAFEGSLPSGSAVGPQRPLPAGCRSLVQISRALLCPDGVPSDHVGHCITLSPSASLYSNHEEKRKLKMPEDPPLPSNHHPGNSAMGCAASSLGALLAWPPPPSP